ncbi:MAG TPA: CrcB family protein [Acidothermaceae bacterium]
MSVSGPIDPDIEPAEFENADGGSLGVGLPTLPSFSVHIALVVFVGGLAGGLARYLVGRAWPTPPRGFPWNTFAVNVSGSFALAVLVVVVVEVLAHRTHAGLARYLRPALGTGFLGAFTTFSALTLSTDQLIAHSHVVLGLVYLVASVAAGLLAAIAGLRCGRLLGHRWSGSNSVSGSRSVEAR